MAEFFTVLHNHDCREVTSPSRSHHNCSHNPIYRICVYVRMCVCSMYVCTYICTYCMYVLYACISMYV